MYEGTPSFIKIDVKGHELSVLKGGINVITKHIDYEGTFIRSY